MASDSDAVEEGQSALLPPPITVGMEFLSQLLIAGLGRSNNMSIINRPGDWKSASSTKGSSMAIDRLPPSLQTPDLRHCEFLRTRSVLPRFRTFRPSQECAQGGRDGGREATIRIIQTKKIESPEETIPYGVLSPQEDVVQSE